MLYCLILMLPFAIICKGIPVESTVAENLSVSCIMDDQESAIYIYPDPDITVERKNQSFTITDATWSVKKSTESLLGPVTDKRWQEFPVEYKNYFRFSLERSIVLSLFANKSLEIEIFVPEEDFFDYVSVHVIGNEKWIHFGIMRINGNVCIFRDGDLIKQTMDTKIQEIYIRSNDSMSWKRQEYNYSYSEVAGQYNYTVPDELGSCLILYVSMCSQCGLKVEDCTIAPNNSTEISMESWQHRKIEIKGTKKEITLYKEKYNDSVPEFWRIDIRACPETPNGKISEPKDESPADNSDSKSSNEGFQMKETGLTMVMVRIVLVIALLV